MSPLSATLREALLVTAVGVALGLGANALRERGLDLGRDHFPTSTRTVTRTTDQVVMPATELEESPGEAADTDAASEPESEPTPDPAPSDDEADTTPAPTGIDPAVAQRLAAKGLSASSLLDVQAFVEHEFYEYGLYMLLDARRPAAIEAGHIPGAKAWDPYAPELSATDEMLGLLLGAERVIVYCNGGDCEDSETAALQLLGFGVNPAGLSVFAGGWSEWTAAGMPVEKGAP